MEKIRREQPADGPAVRRVLESAFGTSAEADLVERLHASGKAVIALVAEDGEDIVGYAAFSPLTLEPLAGTVGVGLAPLAVLPERAHYGVGRRLVQNGLAEAKSWGAGFVSVLGEPDYYGRFGFESAARHGLHNEYGADNAFMVFELKMHGLPPPGTLVRYAPEFAEVKPGQA